MTQIKEIVKKVYKKIIIYAILMEHVDLKHLIEYLSENQIGVFLETAHPANSQKHMEDIIGKGNIPLPEKLAEFMKGEKKSNSLDQANMMMFREFFNQMKLVLNGIINTMTIN